MLDSTTRLLPGFSTPVLDRCDDVRSEPEKLARYFADPAASRLCLDGLDPLIDGDGLTREPLPPGAQLIDHILLGKCEDGQPLFVELRGDIPHGGKFAPRVWEAAALLAPSELNIYGCARSLVDWHARHGFCAACGGPTKPVKAGWSRRCNHCEAEHFPRVDPVVIMLAEHGGCALVGRQAHYPPHRYSALAGFVEPGETIEAAVVRELFEEAGVRTTRVHYAMSQPWPFPSSIMIACIAQVEDDQLNIDEREIEDAFWVHREAVQAAMDGEETAPFVAPPPMAVAYHLLQYWLDVTG